MREFRQEGGSGKERAGVSTRRVRSKEHAEVEGRFWPYSKGDRRVEGELPQSQDETFEGVGARMGILERRPITDTG